MAYVEYPVLEQAADRLVRRVPYGRVYYVNGGMEVRTYRRGKPKRIRKRKLGWRVE